MKRQYPFRLAAIAIGLTAFLTQALVIYAAPLTREQNQEQLNIVWDKIHSHVPKIYRDMMVQVENTPFAAPNAGLLVQELSAQGYKEYQQGAYVAAAEILDSSYGSAPPGSTIEAASEYYLALTYAAQASSDPDGLRLEQDEHALWWSGSTKSTAGAEQMLSFREAFFYGTATYRLDRVLKRNAIPPTQRPDIVRMCRDMRDRYRRAFPAELIGHGRVFENPNPGIFGNPNSDKDVGYGYLVEPNDYKCDGS